MNTRKASQVVSLMVLALAVVSAWVEKAGADFTFGTPVNLGPTVNSASDDLGAEISTDGLELYFSSDRPGGFGDWDLYVAVRATTQDDWGATMNLGSPPNSQYGEWEPSISTDGLALYFADVYPAYGSSRPDGLGMRDIWVSTRPTKADPWAAPANPGPPINSQWGENWPAISADGLSLYLCCHTTERGGFGLYDIFVAKRQATSEPFGEPVNLGPNVNSSTGEITPAISVDELTLFFYRGDRDMWMATRKNTSDPFGPAVKLPEPVNTFASEDGSPFLSADGSTLYFCSDRPGGFGGYDLWQVPIIPIVDFNSDGIVDLKDLVRLIECWGQNEPSVDIAPGPFGDGVVDVKDLDVLMSYWQQEILPVSLLAYWKLDETEGDIAYDSIGVYGYDGVLHGVPTWQPAGGAVDGALAFDGIGDYVSTPFVLNPVDGPFGVFAWIKGGAPGHVILSQTGGVDWLWADSSEGKLVTGLMPPPIGRLPPQPLASEFVITDGVWHRIGFVWDGAQRMLYVDDIEVARDTQTGLAGSTGGLHIGTGKALEPGSFFSGLIDDIRIYNCAAQP